MNTPYDVNSPSFDSELYSQKVIKEATLSQLMAQETQIVRQIHSLDSDMQTLVYENYNKFISATDTIKQMRVDFRDMEGEMDQLAEKMKALTERSATVNQVSLNSFVDYIVNYIMKVAKSTNVFSSLSEEKYIVSSGS